MFLVSRCQLLLNKPIIRCREVVCADDHLYQIQPRPNEQGLTQLHHLLDSNPASSGFAFNLGLFFTLQVSSSNASTISQPILQLSGDSQAQVAQVTPGQDLNAAAGQTLQSVQLVSPGTFLIQAQTVTATGQIQWQTFQVTLCLQHVC